VAEQPAPNDATREERRREIARLRDDLTRAEPARDQPERACAGGA